MMKTTNQFHNLLANWQKMCYSNPASQIPLHFSSISNLQTKTTSEIYNERCQELPTLRNKYGKGENGTEFAEISKKSSKQIL